jgi:hypothetical protein
LQRTGQHSTGRRSRVSVARLVSLLAGAVLCARCGYVAKRKTGETGKTGKTEAACGKPIAAEHTRSRCSRCDRLELSTPALALAPATHWAVEGSRQLPICLLLVPEGRTMLACWPMGTRCSIARVSSRNWPKALPAASESNNSAQPLSAPACLAVAVPRPSRTPSTYLAGPVAMSAHAAAPRALAFS